MDRLEYKTMDSAPKDGTPVRLYAMLGDYGYRWRDGYFDNVWRQKWRTLTHGGLTLEHPRYWMPLPEPKHTRLGSE